ncbi:MAG: phosphatase PAP2 family protein [Deltaproteobacteria bacterium]|nr:phosphatase PAP2 family protein [Deltaproteobacteria bacterium]
MNTGGSIAQGAVRRFLFYYIFFLIVVQQVVFVLVGLLGLDLTFDPVLRVWVFVCFVPVPLAAWRVAVERRVLAEAAWKNWIPWALTGVVMFGLWSGSYFAVGLLTDPANARLLPPEWERFDRFVPFDPSFVFLYICVYPFFLLPFLRMSSNGPLLRLVIGLVIMLAISYAFFLTMPVTYPRPSLPDGPEFPVWVMQIVHGRDPPWNCLPSTHCAVALLAALTMYESSRKLGIWALMTAFLIALSTIFTKQHYIVDAIAGFALAGLTYWLLLWIWRNPEKIPKRARQLIRED